MTEELMMCYTASQKGTYYHLEKHSHNIQDSKCRDTVDDGSCRRIHMDEEGPCAVLRAGNRRICKDCDSDYSTYALKFVLSSQVLTEVLD